MKKPQSKYNETKKRDAPLYQTPTSTQEIFPIKSIDASGIFELNEKRFSKMYTLSDINFMGLTEIEQQEILIAYSKVLNTIPCRFQFTVANEYVNEDEFNNSILYEYKEDENNELRKIYNQIIQEKLTDAKQGLYQTIYLTLTIVADDMHDAKGMFSSMESPLRAAFIGLGSRESQGAVMKAVSINKRMQLLYNIMHVGLHTNYEFNFEKNFKNKHDWINDISPASIIFNTEDFETNNAFGKTIYISKYPKTLESDIIIALSQINCTSYISVNSELIDINSLKKELGLKYASVDYKIENIKKSARREGDYLSDGSSQLQEVKEALEDMKSKISSEDNHYFNTTIMISFFAETKDELQKLENKIINIISLKSLDVESCFLRQKEGLISSLPLGVQEYKEVTNFTSVCLAMFIPFKTQELYQKNGIYYGVNQLSQNAIIANRKTLKNYNGLILGQPGSGKSFFAKNEIISTFLNCVNDQIIIVDPQNEYKILAKALKGSVISFDGIKELYINPLDVDFNGVDYIQLNVLIQEKTDFILTLLSSCIGRKLSSEEMGIINDVVEKIYRKNYELRSTLNGTTDNEIIENLPSYMKKKDSLKSVRKTVSSNEEQIKEFSPILQDVYQELLNNNTKESSHLASAMQIFVNGSLNLFNHRTNVDINSRFLVFDISRLQENIRPTAMLIMMETIKNKVRDNSLEKKWTHLYIDEFHELLSTREMAKFMVGLWKKIRKISGVLTGITQNATDLLKGGAEEDLKAILSDSDYFALLSQSTIDKNKLIELMPNISEAMFSFVDNAESGTGILKMGGTVIPFDMTMSKDNEIYKLINTDAGEGKNVSI